jgi:hypothetical protein
MVKSNKFLFQTGPNHFLLPFLQEALISPMIVKMIGDKQQPAMPATEAMRVPSSKSMSICMHAL